MEIDAPIIVALVVMAIITFFLVRGPSSSSSSDTTSNDKRNLIKKAIDEEKKAIVIYISQTGTAETYAHSYGKELEAKFNCGTIIADIDDYDLTNLHDVPSDIKLFFFVASYGDGGLPDTGAIFDEYLDSLDDGSLTGLNYTIFGLGNSSYETFNGGAKKVNSILEKAGGKKFMEFRVGDSGKLGMEDTFENWKVDSFEVLEKIGF